MSTPPVTSQAARCSRMRLTAVTTAARPEASLWLIVALGPRSLNSRPARLAAALPTVLLKTSPGTPAGPLRNNAPRYSWIIGPPADQVPNTTPPESSPDDGGGVFSIAIRAATIAYAAVGSIRRSFIGEIHEAGSNPLTAAARVVRHPRASNALTGAIPVRPSSKASRNASQDVPNGETIPTPEIPTGARMGLYVTIAVVALQKHRVSVRPAAIIPAFNEADSVSQVVTGLR